jgi:hypothetical protein
MSTVLPLLLFATLSAALSAGERTPAVLLLIVPKDATLRASSSALFDSTSRVLESDTRLILLPPERAGVDAATIAACDPGERFSCWLRAARAASAPKYVWVLIVQPAEHDREELTLFFIDAARALRESAQLPRDDPDHAEKLESLIFDLAIQVGPVQLDSIKPHELESWLRAAIAGPLAAALDPSQERAPLGRILLFAPHAGIPIALEGEVIGATQAKETELRDVRPGARRLAITVSGGPPLTRDVEVRAGRTTTVAFALDLDLDLDENAPMLRYGMFAGGAASVVLGGVFLVAAVQRAGAVAEGCLMRPGDNAACEDLGAITFAHSPDDLPALDTERANPPSVPIFALALGLIAHGAISGAGALYFEDEGDLWIPFVAGIAAGALTFGAGALLDPR